MGESDSAVLRIAALHMDRYRHVIQAEVHRRLGRAEPPPYPRAEIVRRFRSYCRLASAELASARPSLDGLGGNPSAGLERAVATAVEVAREKTESEELRNALRWLEARFCAGIRHIMQPSERDSKPRRGHRRTLNAGRRVRSAIDRISDAYLALCLDTGRLYDMNPAAESLFGVDATQLLEHELSEFVSPASRNGYHDLEARLDAGETCGPMEMVFRRPRGDSVEVEVTIANHTIGGRRLAIFLAREKLSRIA